MSGVQPCPTQLVVLANLLCNYIFTGWVESNLALLVSLYHFHVPCNNTLQGPVLPCRSACSCNQMHLRIVFVLLYSVCHPVSVLLCVDVIQYFTCYYFGCHWKMCWEHERKWEAAPTAFCKYHQKIKIKQEPLAVACLLLPTSNLLLPLTVYIWRKWTGLGVQKPNKILPQNRWMSNSHSLEEHGGHYASAPVA